MSASLVSSSADMRERLIVALDLPDVAAARAMVARLGEAVRWYKVGMWLLFEPEFSGFVDELVRAGRGVFLDYKMYDIPETVRRGVAAVARRGVRMVTVHGDPEIVTAAVAGAAGSDLMVLVVTVLTSQDDAAVRAMGVERTVPELVRLRAAAAAGAGAAGVIASASDDLAGLKAMGLRVVTPGIRLPGGGADDQKRAATPDAAIARGADYLVVGRPIVRAVDPVGVVGEVVRSMGQSVVRG